MPIITHFTILAWITHKHQTPLLQCFFTQNWWLNFPASVNVSAANWSWLTVKIILHPWPFPSFSCSSMTQQKQKTWCIMMTVTAGGSGTQGWPNLSIRSHSPSQRNEVEQKINLRKKVSCWQPRWENHLKVEPHRRNDSFVSMPVWYLICFSFGLNHVRFDSI